MSDGCDSLDIVEKAAVGAELNRCRVLAAKIANELRNKRPEQFSDSGWFSAACILALSTGPANVTAITDTINFNAGGYSQSTSTANFSASSGSVSIVVAPIVGAGLALAERRLRHQVSKNRRLRP
jgi:hypothetical protein